MHIHKTDKKGQARKPSILKHDTGRYLSLEMTGRPERFCARLLDGGLLVGHEASSQVPYSG